MALLQVLVMPSMNEWNLSTMPLLPLLVFGVNLKVALLPMSLATLTAASLAERALLIKQAAPCMQALMEQAGGHTAD